MAHLYPQTFPTGAAPAAPQLALLREVVQQRLALFGRALWQGLERQGQRRADRELTALAERWKAINPTLARELRSYVRGGSSY